jgi:serine O-acetyltransferase
MAQSQATPALDKLDPVWTRIRREAEEIVRKEPALATFIYSTILHRDALEEAIVYRLAERLDHAALSGELIRQAYSDALREVPAIGDAFRADLMATADRDPATHRIIEPVLYYKGFQAIATHRLMHWLWQKGRRDFALYLQSRMSAVFQCDIHPAAKIGRGIFLDHATGLVVGETAEIGDDVSMQGVGRPPSEDTLRRYDRSRRQNPRKHRSRSLRPHRRGLRRDQAGSEQCHRGWGAGEGRWTGRLS